LAEHFEVSVRTVERDLSAIGQAGVPLATKPGRGGGYALDRSISLPPLNFTPREAAAVAVALSRSEHVLFRRDARTALQKIVAAMPERALQEARATAEKVRLPNARAKSTRRWWIALTRWGMLRSRSGLSGGPTNRRRRTQRTQCRGATPCMCRVPGRR
jgi:predicted DNA-binding transcriptional regulator YafY